MADGGEPQEITSLRSNLTSITDAVTVGDNLQWFANSLVEKTLISQRAAQGILGAVGATPAYRAGQLLDSVFAVIRSSDRKRHWFDEFVSIFSTEKVYAELVEKLLKCGVSSSSNDQQSFNLPSQQPPLHSPQPPTSLDALAPTASAPSPSATGFREPPIQSSPPPLPPDQPPPSPHQPFTSSFWSLEKVKATIENLEEMFGNLCADAETELTEKESQDEMFFKRFRYRLLLLPVRKATLHVKFFDAKEDEILAAKNTIKVLAILCRFVDYRNFEIIYYVVIKFCSMQLQEAMQRFCKTLEEFETATTVDVYLSAIPDEVDEELMNGFSEMVVKIDKPESKCTLLEIRKLNKAIIEKSTLCSHSVYIGAVSRNCVVVRFRFPSTALGWVLAAITPEFMATHHITEVAVDGKQLSVVQANRYELVRCMVQHSCITGAILCV